MIIYCHPFNAYHKTRSSPWQKVKIRKKQRKRNPKKQWWKSALLRRQRKLKPYSMSCGYATKKHVTLAFPRSWSWQQDHRACCTAWVPGIAHHEVKVSRHQLQNKGLHDAMTSWRRLALGEGCGTPCPWWRQFRMPFSALLLHRLRLGRKTQWHFCRRAS